MNKNKHPSGLSWERWEWPFKTPDERKLVAAYFKRQAKDQKKKQIEQLEEALL